MKKVKACIVTWDEVGCEWSNHGLKAVSGPFDDPKTVAKVNRALNGGYDDDEGWVIKGMKMVEDLATVSPSDYGDESQDRQSFVSGPGWAVETRSADRDQLAILLIKEAS